MTTDLRSATSEPNPNPAETNQGSAKRHGWLKVGAFAAASALLGGMAAAWFYRKTLSQLQEAQNTPSDPGNASTEDGSGEDF